MEIPAISRGRRAPLFLFGLPREVGGASTKIAHLIRLLREFFEITVVVPDVCYLRDKVVRRLTEPFGARLHLLKDLPETMDGVGLAICGKDFFRSGTAAKVKARGLKLVWSNEMMWALSAAE